MEKSSYGHRVGYLGKADATHVVSHWLLPYSVTRRSACAPLLSALRHSLFLTA